jgi:hypothetical protein
LISRPRYAGWQTVQQLTSNGVTGADRHPAVREKQKCPALNLVPNDSVQPARGEREPIHCPKCDAVFDLPLPAARPTRQFRAVAPLETEVVPPVQPGSPEDVPEADDDDNLSLMPADDDEDDILNDDGPDI